MALTYNNFLNYRKEQRNNKNCSMTFSQSMTKTCRNYSIPNFKQDTQCVSTLRIQTQPALSGIKVVCRFRPMNKIEKSYKNKEVAKILSDKQVEIQSDTEFYAPSFQFDKIFSMADSQSELYKQSSESIVQSVLEGYNGTIMAYGQTASGKTHTMQGILNNDQLQGVIPRAAHQIFSYVNERLETNEESISISLTMIEIYMERVNDLLNLTKQNLNIREGKDKKHFIDDVSEYPIKNESELLLLFKQGVLHRTVGSTHMNEYSSRSHCIVIITISQKNLISRVTKKSKLYLVDLAGSEKASKTKVTGLNLEEAKNINKSLSALGLIIKTLTDGTSTHIPFRESKLTRILSESLGGNSKTCLILTCSPSSYNEAETLSTLRFGTRAKKIRNKPIINKQLTLSELKEKLAEMTKLIDDKNHRIRELEKRIVTNGNNTEFTQEEDQNELDLKECLRDLTIVDKDTERLINELNCKIKDQDDYYQKEINELQQTINELKGTLSQRESNKELTFNNLKIKNVFHTIYNNNTLEIPTVSKSDKCINTEPKQDLVINEANAFSILSIAKMKPTNDYSYYFIQICLCIIFSYGIHFLIEYV